MRIAFDVVGGDCGLESNIDGAVRAARTLGCEVSLVGPGEAVRKALSALRIDAGDKRYDVVDAPDAIQAADDPAAACRDKPHSSIMTAAQAVAQQRAQALVSAGDPAVATAAALWHLRRLPGVLRPAIARLIPTAQACPLLLIDAGAGVDGKPWHLLQFATMGSLYAERMLKIAHPKIGLLSGGLDRSQLSETVRDASALLKYSGLNFVGLIGGGDIPAGLADVAVCDGFVGDICHKLIEGAGAAMASAFQSGIERNPITKLGGLMIGKAGGGMTAWARGDMREIAPLLGVGAPTVICGRRSDAEAICFAHRMAKEMAETELSERIRKTLEQMKASLEMPKIASV